MLKNFISFTNWALDIIGIILDPWRNIITKISFAVLAVLLIMGLNIDETDKVFFNFLH